MSHSSNAGSHLTPGQPVVSVGVPLGHGQTVMIMVHGRNAGPENILDLVPRLDRFDFTFLAPSAAGRTWYPLSFLAETSKNEPGLSSGLRDARSPGR